MKQSKLKRKKRIQKRIRKKITGTTTRPRLSVFRSNKEIYAQIIDDNGGCTLCTASSREGTINGDGGTKTVRAKRVGQLLASKAVEKGIQEVVFDRGGYLYHGRVKALAEGAREGGLNF